MLRHLINITLLLVFLFPKVAAAADDTITGGGGDIVESPSGVGSNQGFLFVDASQVVLSIVSSSLKIPTPQFRRIGIGTPAVLGYRLVTNGKMAIAADNRAMYFGADYDAGIWYDGSNFVVEPSGYVSLLGDLQLNTNVIYGGAATTENLTLHSNTSNDGLVQIAGTVDIDEAENDVTLHLGTQDYKLLTCGGNCYTEQAQGVGTEAHKRLMSHDGDGTDDVYYSIHGVGTPVDTTNRERLALGWDSGGGIYRILMEANGTGSARELRIGVNGHPGMLSFQTDGTLRLGTVTGGNYTEIEADGTPHLVGDAKCWKDINVGAVTLFGPPGQQPDTDNFVDEVGAGTGIYTYAVDVGEAVSGSFEIQHDYAEGTDLYFYLHWQGVAAPTGTDKVQWQLTYTVSRLDATVDAVTVITIETDFDTQYEQVRSFFAAIDGDNFEVGDQFLFTLERIAATTDEYSGDALLMTVGIHYEVDTLGSRLISTK